MSPGEAGSAICQLRGWKNRRVNSFHKSSPHVFAIEMHSSPRWGMLKSSPRPTFIPLWCFNICSLPTVFPMCIRKVKWLLSTFCCISVNAMIPLRVCSSQWLSGLYALLCTAGGASRPIDEVQPGTWYTLLEIHDWSLSFKLLYTKGSSYIL